MKKQNNFFRLSRRNDINCHPELVSGSKMLKQVQHDSLIKTKNAFTLAEVLIAVVIIGTLATLTIATYMTTSTSWNNQYVAGLKKVYSELSYATDRIKANNSGTLIAALSGTHEARDLFCTTLKCSKICEAGSIQDNCWANSTLKLSGGVPVESFDPELYHGAVLSDGSFFLINIGFPSCDGTGVSVNLPYSSDTNHRCGNIWIDVNGFKTPNTFGRDLFLFSLGANGFYSGGDSHTIYNDLAVECDASQATKNGYGCAAQVLQDGKMLY